MLTSRKHALTLAALTTPQVERLDIHRYLSRRLPGSGLEQASYLARGDLEAFSEVVNLGTGRRL